MPADKETHIVPLACDGLDAVSNLPWQTVVDARAKEESPNEPTT
jgi:hypothetical protein